MAAVLTTVCLIATVSIVGRAESNGDARLVNGRSEMEGIPEFLWGSSWFPLCDEYILPEIAFIICRQLKLPSTSITLNDDYQGKWNRDDWWFKCDPDAYRLFYDCRWPWVYPRVESCHNSTGIRCGGNMRFLGGDDFIEGQVQVYEGGTWHAICNADTTYTMASIACTQMGLRIYRGTAAAIRGLSYTNTSGTKSITCLGSETRLDQCLMETHECAPADTYIVTCNATLIEIMAFENSSMQDCYNISDSNPIAQNTLRERCEQENNAFPLVFTYNNVSGFWCGLKTLTEVERTERLKMASVVCYELGFSRQSFEIFTIARQDEEFHIAPGHLSCSGREDNLTACSRHVNLGQGSCDEETDDFFSLYCKPPLRLHALNRSAGLLSMPDQITADMKWVHVSNAHTGLAMVACRELGYDREVDMRIYRPDKSDIDLGYASVDSAFVSERVGLLSAELFSDIPEQAFMGMRIDCTGEESLLRECYFSPDSSLVDSNPSSALGVDCDATSIHVEMLNVSLPSRGLLMMNAAGDSMAHVCAYDLKADERSNLAAVLCHQFGFSRFGAELLVNHTDTLMLNGTTPSGFVDARWRCIGTENTISECLLYRVPNISICSTVFSLSCHDNSYCEADQDYFQPKSIKCHDSRSCSRDCHKREECSLQTGACRLYTKFSDNRRNSEYTSCVEECKPFSSFGDDELQVRCCYSDWCNEVNKVIPEQYLYQLIDGVFLYDGYVQVKRSDEWIYLRDDENYSITYLTWLCENIGHYQSEVARLPSTRTAARCITVGNQETCVANNDFNGRCVGELGNCDGHVLHLSCNAAPAFTRLVDGGSMQMGRVEVFYNNEWGTICTQGFTPESVGVICRSLGFAGGCGRSSYTDSAVRFRPGEEGIHFTNVRCEGWEPNIWKCKLDLVTSCPHSQDLHIICPAAPTHLKLRPDITANVTWRSVNKNTTATKTNNTANLRSAERRSCPEQQCETFPCKFNKSCSPGISGYCTVKRVALSNGDPSFLFDCEIDCDSENIRDNITDVTLRSLNSTTLCCSVTNCTGELFYMRNDKVREAGTTGNGCRHNKLDILGVVIMVLPLVYTCVEHELR